MTTNTTTTAEFISRHQAALRFGVTRARLAQAIAAGHVRAKYPSISKVLVSVDDLERLLSTPPTATKA